MYTVTVKYYSGTVQVRETDCEGEMLDRVRIFTGSPFVKSVKVTRN